jgi:hypothetical protein
MFFQISFDTLGGVANPLEQAKTALRRLKISRYEIIYIEEEKIREPEPDGWPIGEYKLTVTIAPTVRSSIAIMRDAIKRDGSPLFVEISGFEVPVEDVNAVGGADRVGDRRRWDTGF